MICTEVRHMSDNRVTLLGTPCVYRDGKEIHFPYRKAEGIFYYLCVEKQTNRDELVSLFGVPAMKIPDERTCAKRCFRSAAV